MFKEKNLSPKQLAALTALLLASLIAISIYILFTKWELLLVYFIVSFAIIYFLLYEILERFIYRKIKLIYKLISQTKASKREEAYQKYILPKKGIDDVREDVEAWAAQKAKEIQDAVSGCVDVPSSRHSLGMLIYNWARNFGAAVNLEHEPTKLVLALVKF